LSFFSPIRETKDKYITKSSQFDQGVLMSIFWAGLPEKFEPNFGRNRIAFLVLVELRLSLSMQNPPHESVALQKLTSSIILKLNCITYNIDIVVF
jgi:hypothetical protein